VGGIVLILGLHAGEVVGVGKHLDAAEVDAGGIFRDDRGQGTEPVLVEDEALLAGFGSVEIGNAFVMQENAKATIEVFESPVAPFELFPLFVIEVVDQKTEAVGPGRTGGRGGNEGKTDALVFKLPGAGGEHVPDDDAAHAVADEDNGFALKDGACAIAFFAIFEGVE